MHVELLIKGRYTLGREDQVTGELDILDMNKSMGPCRPIKHYIQKHTQVLRELTHVIVQPLPSTTEGKYHCSLQDIQE